MCRVALSYWRVISCGICSWEQPQTTVKLCHSGQLLTYEFTMDDSFRISEYRGYNFSNRWTLNFLVDGCYHCILACFKEWNGATMLFHYLSLGITGTRFPATSVSPLGILVTSAHHFAVSHITVFHEQSLLQFLWRIPMQCCIRISPCVLGWSLILCSSNNFQTMYHLLLSCALNMPSHNSIKCHCILTAETHFAHKNWIMLPRPL